MKVFETTSPIKFVTGEMLDVTDMNAMFSYARDATIFTARKRYVRSVLVIPFVTSVTSAYTHTDIGTDKVKFRIKCAQQLLIERAYLSVNVTCSSELKVDITTAAGATPSGAVSPWLTTGGAVTDASVDTEDLASEQVTLAGGTEYVITVSGGGAAVDMQRFDVVLHLLSDRWNTTGTPVDQSGIASAITALDPASTTTAADITSRKTTIETYAANFATYKTAVAPMMFHIHGLTSALDADLRTFRIPRFDSARAQSKIIRMYVHGLTSAAGTPGKTITATLKNTGGTTLATATADASGSAGWITGDSGALTQSVTGSTIETASNDYTVVLATNAASTVTKAHVILWISR